MGMLMGDSGGRSLIHSQGPTAGNHDGVGKSPDPAGWGANCTTGYQPHPLFPDSFSFSPMVREPDWPSVTPLLPDSFSSWVPTAPFWVPVHPDFPASFFCPSAPPALGWAPHPLAAPPTATPAPVNRVATHIPVRIFFNSLVSIGYLRERNTSSLRNRLDLSSHPIFYKIQESEHPRNEVETPFSGNRSPTPGRTPGPHQRAGPPDVREESAPRPHPFVNTWRCRAERSRSGERS